MVGEGNNLFRFKRFSISNGKSGLKVGTDGVLLGAIADVRSADRRVLDVGTGTGLIALMLAQRYEKVCIPSGLNTQDGGIAGEQIDGLPEIIGIDIDGQAAAQAAANFSASPWAQRLCAVHRSLQDYCDDWMAGGDGFDLIASNPPYFDNSLTCPDEQRSTARHTGSMSFREVVTFAAEALTADGILALVLPKDEQVRLTRFASSFGLYPHRVTDIRTTPHKTPKRIVVQLGRQRGRVCNDELTIMYDGLYSDEYRRLTEDFHIIF